jgi:hypothetical protein
MPAPTVVGVFDSAEAAEKAREELLRAGIAKHRIIVGELPDPREFVEPMPDGTCMVAVVARSHAQKNEIAELLLRLGARGTLEARP